MSGIQKFGDCGGRIDLHLHTTNSDGDNTPDEVIRLAAQEELRVISLTDHNKFSFAKPVTVDVAQCETSKQWKMTIIPGCEFSASYPVLAWNGETTEIHIIGLFPDGVDSSEFEDLFADLDEGKQQYVKAILKQLNERGIDITLDEVEAASIRTGHSGRHKIADVLIQKGYARDMDDAFDRHIGNFSPFYIPSTRYVDYAPMKEVVSRIRVAGGIPILAHPYGYAMDEAEMETLISDFKTAAGSFGGLEVYYELYVRNQERMTFLKKMAMKYGLLASVASDRHRGGQPFASTDGLDLYEKMLEILHSDKKRK